MRVRMTAPDEALDPGLLLGRWVKWGAGAVSRRGAAGRVSRGGGGGTGPRGAAPSASVLPGTCAERPCRMLGPDLPNAAAAHLVQRAHAGAAHRPPKLGPRHRQRRAQCARAGRAGAGPARRRRAAAAPQRRARGALRAAGAAARRAAVDVHAVVVVAAAAGRPAAACGAAAAAPRRGRDAARVLLAASQARRAGRRRAGAGGRAARAAAALGGGGGGGHLLLLEGRQVRLDVRGQAGQGLGRAAAWGEGGKELRALGGGFGAGARAAGRRGARGACVFARPRSGAMDRVLQRSPLHAARRVRAHPWSGGPCSWRSAARRGRSLRAYGGAALWHGGRCKSCQGRRTAASRAKRSTQDAGAARPGLYRCPLRFAHLWSCWACAAPYLRLRGAVITLWRAEASRAGSSRRGSLTA